MNGNARTSLSEGTESVWEARGRALYEKAGDRAPAHALTQVEAETEVARSLTLTLRPLPPAVQDEALAAAVRGYLAAHRARGRELAGAKAGRDAEVDVQERTILGLLAERATWRPPTRRPPASSPSARPSRVVTVATFEIANQPALTKGLAAGKVRVSEEDDPLAAVARRIARDTRCVVRAAVVEQRGLAAGGVVELLRCRLTLEGRASAGRARATEQEIEVTIRRPCAPPAPTGGPDG